MFLLVYGNYWKQRDAGVYQISKILTFQKQPSLEMSSGSQTYTCQKEANKITQSFQDPLQTWPQSIRYQKEFPKGKIWMHRRHGKIHHCQEREPSHFFSSGIILLLWASDLLPVFYSSLFFHQEDLLQLFCSQATTVIGYIVGTMTLFSRLPLAATSGPNEEIETLTRDTVF